MALRDQSSFSAALATLIVRMPRSAHMQPQSCRADGGRDSAYNVKHQRNRMRGRMSFAMHVNRHMMQELAGRHLIW